MARWLMLAVFALSVAAPSGLVNMAAADGQASQTAHHGHGAPVHDPEDHGSGGCGDCGQPVFCCSHVSIAPIGALGQRPILGGYIIVTAPQQIAVFASPGAPYHPPKA